MANDDLSDFERGSFATDGKTRTVFRAGQGPAVIVISEMPGISPKVAGFARKVRSAGFTAVMPHLFGEPGRDPTSGNRLAGMAYGLSSMGWGCVSREFATFATGRTSPIVDWLRALGRAEHERCGGPGIGAVGMCFTGGFALGMATEPAMLAPVLSQPSLPFGISKQARAAIDVSDADLATVQHRCAAEGLQVIGLRFTTDRFVPSERFRFLEEKLGDAFIAVELGPETANPNAAMAPHSVLTEHLIDEPGEPTRDALDRVLAFFKEKLAA